MEENTTNETLPSDDNVTPEGGGTAVTPPADAGIKDKLNEALGKDFKDDETALKAVKDTFSHVGDVNQLNTLKETMTELQKTLNTDEAGVIKTLQEKLAEKPAETNPSDFVSKAEFDEATFYGEHPEYKPHKGIINAFRSKPENQGKSISDLVDEKSGDKELTDTLKGLIAQAEAEKSKSVLQSNPRLGQSLDKMSKAQEAAQSGNQEEADKQAVDAVIDAFGI